LRSLQEIQLDFEEGAKAYAGLWSQGKKIFFTQNTKPSFCYHHFNEDWAGGIYI
jgi:hypothetical protein